MEKIRVKSLMEKMEKMVNFCELVSRGFMIGWWLTNSWLRVHWWLQLQSWLILEKFFFLKWFAATSMALDSYLYTQHQTSEQNVQSLYVHMGLS